MRLGFPILVLKLLLPRNDPTFCFHLRQEWLFRMRLFSRRETEKLPVDRSPILECYAFNTAHDVPRVPIVRFKYGGFCSTPNHFPSYSRGLKSEARGWGINYIDSQMCRIADVVEGHSRLIKPHFDGIRKACRLEGMSVSFFWLLLCVWIEHAV